MEKYILIPYEKYQRLQQLHIKVGSGNTEELSKSDTEERSKSPQRRVARALTKKISKRQIHLDKLHVSPQSVKRTVGKKDVSKILEPPPGVRDKKRVKSKMTVPQQRTASIKWLT